MPPSLLSFTSVTFFLVITPGATTALVINQALRFGFRGGAFAALGAAAGNATVAAVAGLGAAFAVSRWPAAREGLRVVGALYLCWLGARTILRASTRRRSILPDSAELAHEPLVAFRQGWLVNVFNPAILAFYVTVVPSFLHVGEEANPFALLAAIHVSMALACHLIWAIGFAAVRSSRFGPRLIAALDVAAGGALVLLGILMLLP